MGKLGSNIDGHIFEKRTDEVFVGTMGGVEPDPDWTYVDKQGHICTQKTKEWFVDELVWCPSCGEDHEYGHWVCPLCLEKLKPGVRPEQRYVPGMTHYLIDGVEVDEDEWHRAYEEAAG